MGFEGFQNLIDDRKACATADAGRYAELNWDMCQLCGASGEDKRTLILRYFYDIKEIVPEAIGLSAVESVSEGQRNGYLLRTCKACRGAFLGHLRDWRAERVARRGIPKDHDGHDAIDDPERPIPVRVDGAIVIMGEAEYEEYWRERERDEQRRGDEHVQE